MLRAFEVSLKIGLATIMISCCPLPSLWGQESARNFDCNEELRLEGCNFIPNPQMSNDNGATVDAFRDGHITGWLASHGRPGVNLFGITFPPTGTNYASLQVGYWQDEGIFCRTPKLRQAGEYVFSFFRATSTTGYNSAEDVSQNFVATVRTVNSMYGCERMRQVTISPDIYECTGVYLRNKNTTATDSANNISLSSGQQSAGFNLYPNPALNSISVITEKQVKEVVIYTADGRNVKRFSNIDFRRPLSLAGLSKGYYLVKVIYQDHYSETKPIIKQ